MTVAPGALADLLATSDPEGRLAPCGIRELVLGEGVLDAVPGTVAGLLGGTGRPRVTLVVDLTAIRAGGSDVKQDLATSMGEDFDVTTVVLDDGHAELHVTDDVVGRAAEACAGADAVVALGGGTISDIGKLAAPAGAVLVTVQTAASVDGFTDDVSVVLRDGVKRTVLSRWPDAVVADTAVVAEAPARMNRAGYGEMTSMLTAPADWRLASLTRMDGGFEPAAIRLLRSVGADLGAWSEGIRTADPAAVGVLTRALALRGVVTGVAGTTAVLSGVEHLVSHMLDQHHAAHSEPTGLHGAQVGVGAVVAAAAWEMLVERLERSVPELVTTPLHDTNARAQVRKAFGSLDATGAIAEECWRDYSAKLSRMRQRRHVVAEVLRTWDRHRPELDGLRRPSAEIATGLVAAGAPAAFAGLDPAVPGDLARWAVANCALMRNRFTVADLLMLTGWWEPQDVDEVLGRARDAVAAANRKRSADVR